MKSLRSYAALAVAAAALACQPAAFAQDHHDDHPAPARHDDHPAPAHHENHPYVRHTEWKKGYHMKQEDWSRGERIDWHAYHLRQPPSGYEWREVDGNYVLAAIATGVVASVIVASSVH